MNPGAEAICDGGLDRPGAHGVNSLSGLRGDGEWLLKGHGSHVIR